MPVSICATVLFALLLDTQQSRGEGMRIGEALGLGHEDLALAERQVTVRPRTNDNRARAKSEGHHVQPVQHRTPQRDPGHRRQVLLRRSHHRGRNTPGRTRQQFIPDIKQQAGIVHLAGALLCRDSGLQ